MRPDHIIIIASSAGGPRILKELFDGFPKINAAVVLVQHMPSFINASFSATLDAGTDLKVKLAEHGEHLLAGHMYIAPTGRHLILRHNTQIQLVEGEKINYVCPAADETMMSVTPEAGMSFTAVVLTGMGKDGAQGVSYIKGIGGTTIAQDEQTSIIYGMPREAARTGDVDFVLSVRGIADKLVRLCGKM